MPGQQYAYLGVVYKGLLRTSLISVQLYRRLPTGTILQSISGELHRKGAGLLSEEPDFRYYGARGEHMITEVGFPARESDPKGVFMAGYREE